MQGTSGVFRGGALGDAPPPLAWTQKFFEHIEPKKKLKISGEGTPPPHTPPHWRLRRLEPRVFGSAPPSQNPKYATGLNGF